MIQQNMLAWIFVLTVWSANINDLIRGQWFFIGTEAVLFWNMVGTISLLSIILGYKQEIKDAKRSKSE